MPVAGKLAYRGIFTDNAINRIGKAVCAKVRHLNVGIFENEQSVSKTLL
jgi:hypothetical protein